jgi:chromosome partitioning protein
MHIISFYSIKGGVGKTASSTNIAYAAAMDDFRTLLIDLDPVGASSYYFKVNAKPKHSGENIIKGGEKLQKNIRSTDYPKLDVLPADESYRNLDILLHEKKRSTQRLKKSLESIAKGYDLVVIDGTPNLTLLSENILRASDYVFVPIHPSTLSMLALDALYNQLEHIHINKEQIHLFVTMFDKRKKLHIQTVEELLLKSETFATMIPYSSDIERMGLYREPVIATKPKSIGAVAYRGLWREIATLLQDSQ